MTMQRIGSCSICGGDVRAHVGAWWGIVPPPPPTCSQCGAGTADNVIQMVPQRLSDLVATQLAELNEVRAEAARSWHAVNAVLTKEQPK